MKLESKLSILILKGHGLYLVAVVLILVENCVYTPLRHASAMSAVLVGQDVRFSPTYAFAVSHDIITLANCKCEVSSKSYNHTNICTYVRMCSMGYL